MDKFYYLKKNTIKNIKDILVWADSNSIRTNVTVLDCKVSWARQNSDKDFNTVINLIRRRAKPFFRVILRKDRNLFGILYNKCVISDVLEVVIRSIDVGRKEYFIMIYMEPEYLNELKQMYELIEIK